MSRHLGIKIEPSKKDEKKLGKPEAGAATGKPKAQSRPKVTPVVPPKREAEPLTGEKIAEAAAAGVAKALGRQTGPESGPKPDEPTPQEERKVAVLTRMEKLYAEKYTGLADKYRTSVRKLREYAANWEKENPGKEFDESAEEHEEFFAENDIEWDDDDYTEALADIRTDKRLEAERKPLSEKLSKLETKERLREATPIINQEQVSAARQFWSRLGDAYKDLVNERGVVDQAKLEALQKADPTGFELQVQSAVALENETAELYKLLNGLTEYDPKNEMHVELGQFAEKEEMRIAALPDQEKLDAKGRAFLPAADYYKVPKAERERYYWTLSVADLAALRAADRVKTAKENIEKEEAKHRRWAEARGIKLAENSADKGPGESGEGAGELDETDGKPLSPTVGAESIVAATAKAAANNDPNPLRAFGERFLGKR